MWMGAAPVVVVVVVTCRLQIGVKLALVKLNYKYVPTSYYYYYYLVYSHEMARRTISIHIMGVPDYSSTVRQPQIDGCCAHG